MRHHLLIAVAAVIAAQPVASLPLPVKKTGRDHVMRAGGRIAPTGCAVDALPSGADVWRRAPMRQGNLGALEELRQRRGRVHDRCVPRRQCFTDQRSVGTRGIANSPFRTPPFLGK